MTKAGTLIIAILFLHCKLLGQISEGGSPLGFSINNAVYTGILLNTAPDINTLIKEDSLNKNEKLLRIGALVPLGISYPNSGTFYTLNDGRIIWRVRVTVPNAPAIGLYYNRFHLPPGVKYYICNENRTQVLGAYTANQNAENGWATEKVQGEVADLELDMDANTDTGAIFLDISDAAVFYRSVNYLQKYAGTDPLLRTTKGPYLPYDSSSPCEINAVCATILSYQKKATIKIEYIEGRFVYGATGTLINNTANDCTTYLLTASHVEPSNSTSNTIFSKWVFYFNYETPACTYSGPQPGTSQTLTGATFKARSSYDSSSNKIAGDFILVELTSSIPASYGAYLSGWDRSGDIPTGQCLSFHHPDGDVKKVSYSNTVSPLGNFNNAEPNSHWEVNWQKGGTEEGSSGSGLFDQNTRLIGDLSGGFISSPSCVYTNSKGDTMSDYAEYSKFSLNWLNAFQSPSSASTRLKDWLDPSNTGNTTVNAISCGSTISVNQNQKLEDQVSVYPNPTQGVANVKFNFSTPGDVKIELFNLIGARLSSILYTNTLSGNYNVDISTYPDGVYLLNITANNSRITKKIILSK